MDAWRRPTQDRRSDQCPRLLTTLPVLAPVHIDAALIEAERQVRDLLTEANKVPSDNDAVEQVWIVIDRMVATPAKTRWRRV